MIEPWNSSDPLFLILNAKKSPKFFNIQIVNIFEVQALDSSNFTFDRLKEIYEIVPINLKNLALFSLGTLTEENGF